MITLSQEFTTIHETVIILVPVRRVELFLNGGNYCVIEGNYCELLKWANISFCPK